MSKDIENKQSCNHISEAFAAFKIHLNQLCVFSISIGNDRRKLEQDKVFVNWEVVNRRLEETAILNSGNEKEALQAFEFFNYLRKFILTATDESLLERTHNILLNEINENINQVSKLPAGESYKYFVRDIAVAFAIQNCGSSFYSILQFEKTGHGEIVFFDTHTFINTVKDYFFWIRQEIDKVFNYSTKEEPAAIESVFMNEEKEAEFISYLIHKGIIKNGIDVPKISKQYLAGIIARFEDEEDYFNYNTNWNEITHYVFQKLKIRNPETRVNKNASKDYQNGYLFAKGHFGEIKIKKC